MGKLTTKNCVQYTSGFPSKGKIFYSFFFWGGGQGLTKIPAIIDQQCLEETGGCGCLRSWSWME
jgi:hypothetical protein